MCKQDQDRVHLFEGWAETYDTRLRKDQATFPLQGYGEVLDELVRRIQAAPGLQVLDLGVGTGNLSARLVWKGCAVWGVDFSAEMLTHARAKLPQGILVQADILKEWPAEIQRPFDRVVSAYVLHEFDLEAKIALLHRIASQHLLAGGWIAIADVAFPTGEARAAASRRWAENWDDDEFYWAAD